MYVFVSCCIYILSIVSAPSAAPPLSQPDAAPTSASDNFLLSALVSNLTSGANNNLSSPNDVSFYPIRCFELPPAPPRPERVALVDYYEAVQKTLVRVDSMIALPRTFGPIANPDYTWTGGTCQILLWAPETIVTDPFPIILVAHVAALIADKCLHEDTDHLGGSGSLDAFNGGFVVLGHT